MTHISERPGAVATASLDQANQLFVQGLELHHQGQLNQAMGVYEQVLQLAPEHVEALHHVGIASFQLGDASLAEHFFRLSVALRPDASHAHSALADALGEQQRFDEAVACYDTALSLDPGSAATHYNRGLALQSLRRLDEALGSYDMALSLDSNHERAREKRAAVLRELAPGAGHDKPAAHACPVCHGAAAMLDVVDFNKSCEEARNHYLPLSGRPVYYWRCPQCAFTYAPEIYRWSSEQFLRDIYNEQYVEIDPDYASVRPSNNAALLQQMLGADKQRIKHLDYGGGNGVLAATLRADGWDSSSYDPFPSSDLSLAEIGKFNLITAFEVFEHVPDVAGLMRNLAALMDEECIVMFSTLLSDGQIAPNKRLAWWYASPRNGHISLFSRQSLRLLAEQHGLVFGSFGQNLHCLIKRLPAWAEKLVRN